MVHVLRDRRFLDVAAEPGWAQFADCLNLLEGDLGYPVHELPHVARQGVERFDAEAVARGLDRPAPGAPAQMSLEEAAGVIRQALQSWILVKAGRWQAPRRPDSVSGGADAQAAGA